MSATTNSELGRRFFEAQDRLRGGPDPDLCAKSYRWKRTPASPGPSTRDSRISAIWSRKPSRKKIGELRAQFDQLGMMKQLGVLP